MKRTILILCMLLIGMTSILAQNAFQEYLHCQTDKDIYLAGERLWFRLWSVDVNDHLQQRSRIAYVELVGSEPNDAHCMVELKDAGGCGVIDLPFTLPSGQYQLRAYTRNMLNLGEEAICHRTIAVMNTLRNDTTKDKVSISKYAMPVIKLDGGNISVTTDKSNYSSREKVSITLSELPAMTSVAVSVARQDGHRFSNQSEFVHTAITDGDIVPEVESQIITGRYIYNGVNDYPRTNITFPNPAIHYYPGDISGNKVLFRTPLLNGVETLYTGADGTGHVDLDTPFVSPRLATLPAVGISEADKAELQERSIGLQAAHYFGTDSLKREFVPVASLHRYKAKHHYDMDEYKRFNTFRETFTEYVKECGTTMKDGHRVITMYDESAMQWNDGSTLVLIDGIAVMNHEDLLNYSPRLCKYIDVYTGSYIFGNELYNGILNVRTTDGNASHFTLPSNSKEFSYQGPQTATRQMLVCGDETPTPLPSNIPDARHTLYWNPGTQATQLTCLTSDLKGSFIVTVKGFTPEGEKIEGSTTFTVE